jgi:hypothetical protein
MDIVELQEKYGPFVKQHFVALALGFVGLICLGYGLIALPAPKEQKSDIVI